jgi:signal transduction histidine kinase
MSGDGARLQQVMWNLLMNAVKFTPSAVRIDVALIRTASQLRITVRDTGEGITPEVLPHVFERFRQGDSSSTRRHGGLGLALVKHLREMDGGRVEAESGGLGMGASFTVSLPMQVEVSDQGRHKSLRAKRQRRCREPAGAPRLSRQRSLAVLAFRNPDGSSATTARS